MLYTVTEVAKLLKVNRNFVYKIINNGELILLSMPDKILITSILENIIHTVMKN